MQDISADNVGHCPACGQPVTVRSVRDKKPQYCSRVCAAAARFSNRYRGTSAGPADRPKNILDKTKWES